MPDGHPHVVDVTEALIAVAIVATRQLVDSDSWVGSLTTTHIHANTSSVLTMASNPLESLASTRNLALI
jgi:cupin superfamily acireductone dioxygenase involved in methionine salvage